MLEYLEGWGQAAKDDDMLAAEFDSSSGMQVEEHSALLRMCCTTSCSVSTTLHTGNACSE